MGKICNTSHILTLLKREQSSWKLGGTNMQKNTTSGDLGPFPSIEDDVLDRLCREADLHIHVRDLMRLHLRRQSFRGQLKSKMLRAYSLVFLYLNYGRFQADDTQV